MTDNVLFEMPSQLEDFLFCLPVLQEYMLILRHRGAPHEICVKCRAEFMPLARPVLPGIRLVEQFTNEDITGADLVLKLDRKRARSLGSLTGQHATTCYGRLVGAAPTLRVPCLGEMLVPVEPLVIWLPRHVTDWEPEVAYGRLSEFLSIMGQRLVRVGASIRALPADIDPMQAWKAISAASLCVGVSGGLTALAASLGKAVLEICPPSIASSNWSSKWGFSMYSFITLDPWRVEPEQLADSTESFANALAGGKAAWQRSPAKEPEPPEEQPVYALKPHQATVRV